MGCGSCLMVTLRLFQAVCAVTVIALGVWINHEVSSARAEGDKIIDAVIEDPDREALVRNFFDSLLQTPKRVYYVIGAGTWTLLYLLLLAITYFIARRRDRKNRAFTSSATPTSSSAPKRSHPIPTPLLLILELLTTLALAGAFASITSLTLELEPLCVALDVTVPELMVIMRVCPISKVETVMGGLTWFLSSLTLLTIFVKHCCTSRRRRREQRAKKISFDPAYAGVGGMVQMPAPTGYAALPLPPTPQVDTRYDSHTPVVGQEKVGVKAAYVEVRISEEGQREESGKEEKRKMLPGLPWKKGRGGR